MSSDLNVNAKPSNIIRTKTIVTAKNPNITITTKVNNEVEITNFINGIV